MAKGKRASRSMGKVQEAVKDVMRKRADELGVPVEKRKGLGMKDVKLAENTISFQDGSQAVAEPKQEGLFGPADEIVNALEMGRSRVLLDIDSCVNTITKKKSELEYLDKIRKQFEEAIVMAKAIAEEKNAEGAEK